MSIPLLISYISMKLRIMKMTATTFEFATPNVVAEKFQEGLVVLNLESGKYFDVGERLVPLIDALISGTSVDAIKDGLEAIDAGISVEVDEAIQKMISFDLLQEKPATSLEISKEQCEAIISAGNSFFIEGHDDLAELIAADPIHDIDPVTGRIVR